MKRKPLTATMAGAVVVMHDRDGKRSLGTHIADALVAARQLVWSRRSAQ